MSKIITVRIVEDAARKGNTGLSIEAGTILTPAARDRAKELGISLQRLTTPAAGEVSGLGLREDVNNNGAITQDIKAWDVEGELSNSLRRAVLQRVSRPVDEDKLDLIIRMVIDLLTVFFRDR